MLHKPQTKTPNAIDIHVGSRIRLQRALKGMSQTTLAEGLGVTFQQVQKYEKGTNRVGSFDCRLSPTFSASRSRSFSRKDRAAPLTHKGRRWEPARKSRSS